MKKALQVFSVFLLSLTLTSCFETIEEIDLNADGSGRMTLTLNLSQSKSKVASIMKLSTVNGHKIPTRQEIVSELNNTAAALRNTPGISNVKTNADFTNYIATISFDFKDVSNINTASSKIMQQYKIAAYNTARYSFNKQTKTFIKSYQVNGSTKTQYQQLKNEDKQVFQNANYTSVYRFSSMIKSASNKTTTISKSGKSIMQRVPITNIIHAQSSISNTIQLQ